MGRGRSAETLALVETVNRILAEYAGELTVRQVYYQLVARQVIPNQPREYKRVSRVLTEARRRGEVDPDRITDRLRRAIPTHTWGGLRSYFETVLRSYRREKWSSQPFNVELWVEKDALAGVLEPIARDYEVTLFPCRGFGSYSSLRDAARRLGADPDRPPVVVYMGDFDPSGEAIPRAAVSKLREDHGLDVDLRVVALTADQVDRYNLPHDFTKPGDSRSRGFVERHGDRAVELDALPPDVLVQLARDGIEAFWDVTQFAREQEREAEDLADLRARLAEAS